jgi:hypothetical protein
VFFVWGAVVETLTIRALTVLVELGLSFTKALGLGAEKVISSTGATIC